MVQSEDLLMMLYVLGFYVLYELNKLNTHWAGPEQKTHESFLEHNEAVCQPVCSLAEPGPCSFCSFDPCRPAW